MWKVCHIRIAILYLFVQTSQVMIVIRPLFNVNVVVSLLMAFIVEPPRILGIIFLLRNLCSLLISPFMFAQFSTCLLLIHPKLPVSSRNLSLVCTSRGTVILARPLGVFLPGIRGSPFTMRPGIPAVFLLYWLPVPVSHTFLCLSFPPCFAEEHPPIEFQVVNHFPHRSVVFQRLGCC